jgi:hypothetical protein
MTDFALLDVAIGVIFAILTFSLIASALQEALASALNWRGRMLRRGLFRLLEGATDHGPKLVSATWLTPKRVEQARMSVRFLENPTIRALYGPHSALDKLLGRITLARPGAGSTASTVKAGLERLGRMPSSIPKDTFARALIDTLLADAKVAYRKLDIADGVTPNEAKAAVVQTRRLLATWARDADRVVEQVQGTVARLPMDDQMKARLLRTLREVSLSRALQDKLDALDGAPAEVRGEIEARIARAQAMIDETVLAIGAWFDATMDRVTGWYVRRAKWMLFLLGFAMAAGVNFDVIGYGDRLLNDEELRRRMAVQAEAAMAAERVGEFAVQPGGSRQLATLEVLRLLGRLDPPVGVDEPRVDPQDIARVQAQIEPRELRTALGLNPDAAVPASAAELEAAAAVMARQLDTLLVIDRDGDGQISAAEQDAAIDRFVERMQAATRQSLAVLHSQFAAQGVEFGWSCPDGELSRACAWQQYSAQSLLSWLMIGLGCTLGGQFWFDLLRQAVKVRTAASGLNSDLKRLSGARGGQAQGSG